MGLFYKRVETDREIIITYSCWPSLYVALAVGFGAGLFAGRGAVWIWGAVFAFVLGFLVDMWKPTRELKRAMNSGRVTVSGSKYSFSNPFTAVITKKSPPQF